MTQHVDNLLAACARTLFAIRTLRNHGLPTSAIHAVFQATVIAKLCYASPAWWGFTSAADRGRLVAFVRRSARLRLSPAYVMRQIAASSGTSSPTLGTLYIHSFHPSATNITYFANGPTIVSFRPGHQHSVTITLSCVCYTRTWGSVSPVRRHNFKLTLT